MTLANLNENLETFYIRINEPIQKNSMMDYISMTSGMTQTMPHSLCY